MFKRVFAVFMILCIVAIFCVPQPKAKANVLVDVIESVALGAGVSAAAPIVFVVGVTAVLLGVIFENREQVYNHTSGFFYFLADRQIDINNIITILGSEAVFNAEGIKFYKQYLQTCQLEISSVKTGYTLDTVTLIGDSTTGGWYHYTVIPLPAKFPFVLDMRYTTDTIHFAYELGMIDSTVGTWNPAVLYYTNNINHVGALYNGIYGVIMPQLEKVSFKLDYKVGTQEIHLYDFVGADKGIVTFTATKNLNIGTFLEHSYATHASIVFSTPFTNATVNTIGDLAGVSSVPKSENGLISLDGDMTITIPDVIPVISVVSQTAMTIPAVVEISCSAEAPNITNMRKFSIPQLITIKFPFCIPFDVVRAFELVAKPPVRPYFSMNIPIPQTDVTVPMEIEFSRFDSLALLSRFFFLLIFLIILIVATNKLIGRR